VWQLLVPMAVFGVGNAFVWAPNSATATRNLPMQLAGAGAGVYNATRQLGAVLGAAGIAVLIDARVAALVPGEFDPGQATPGAKLPEVLQGAFSDAMAQAMYLPAGIFVLGLVAALAFERPHHEGFAPTAAGAATATDVPVETT
jgi:hypothetical protein